MKQKRKTPSYRIISGKRRFLCDYHGICENFAYREVYPLLMKGKHKNRGWSYLCRKHFNQENKKFKGKLPSCSIN